MTLTIYFGEILKRMQEIKVNNFDVIYICLPSSIAKEEKLIKEFEIEKYLEWGFGTYEGELKDYLLGIAPYLIFAKKLLKKSGTLFVHGDPYKIHYVKALLLDRVFGRDHFLNELIWIEDRNDKQKGIWPNKHENILVYVNSLVEYKFYYENVDRIDYMAPSLVTEAKQQKKKFPTDTWWFTQMDKEDFYRRLIVSTTEPGNMALGMFPNPTFAEVCFNENRNVVVFERLLPRARDLWRVFSESKDMKWIGEIPNK